MESLLYFQHLQVVVKPLWFTIYLIKICLLVFQFQLHLGVLEVKKGKHILFDIDVKGGLSIKKKYPSNTLSIFVKPPSIKVLKQRLNNRATESDNKIKERIEKAQSEMALASEFDCILVNDDLQTAKKEALDIVGNFLES